MVGKNKRKRNNKKNRLKKSNESQEDQGEIKESVEDDLIPAKRPFNEEESDADDQPRKKKKKKQPVSTDSGEKKGSKSIRQMKKEKHAQRLAAKEAASKDQLQSQCISYLSQWKHDRQNWKFMKIKQVWLYKNKFSSTLLPESSWPTFLEYFESAQGNIRSLLLDDANKVIKQMDEWTEAQRDTKKESKDGNEDVVTEETDINKPDDIAYKRARDLIQCLH